MELEAALKDEAREGDPILVEEFPQEPLTGLGSSSSLPVPESGFAASPRFFSKNMTNLATFQTYAESLHKTLSPHPPIHHVDSVVYTLPQSVFQTTRGRFFSLHHDGTLTVSQDGGVARPALTLPFDEIDVESHPRYPDQLSLWRRAPRSFIMMLPAEKWAELRRLHHASQRAVKSGTGRPRVYLTPIPSHQIGYPLVRRGVAAGFVLRRDTDLGGVSSRHFPDANPNRLPPSTFYPVLLQKLSCVQESRMKLFEGLGSPPKAPARRQASPRLSARPGRSLDVASLLRGPERH